VNQQILFQALVFVLHGTNPNAGVFFPAQSKNQIG
jgi:hypothetical protein